MQKRVAVTLWMVCLFATTSRTFCQGPDRATTSISTDTANPSIELIRYEKEFSSVHIEPAQMNCEFGVAVLFEGTDDLHYYAKAETAPAAGFELKVEAKSESFEFGKAMFPKCKIFTDPTGKKVEVYAGKFTVFLPIKATKTSTSLSISDIEIKISGLACTGMVCLPPFEKTLRATIDWGKRDSWQEIHLETAGESDKVVTSPSYSTWFALSLAFTAGLILNIMPCVWPVLPLIVMRIVGQAKAGRRKAIAMGLAFCLGILLFFACLAGANIILRVFYQTALQWGGQYRSPAFVAAMVLLLVVLALFMLGVFTISVPSSIASKSSSAKGYAGSVGMGFLAAILSTPCSFGILAAAFAWAQTQKLPLGTVAIVIIGLGMAAPYAILTAVPGLLSRLPKGGRWMELFKQAIGFVLLVIAVKLIAALPETRRMGVLYFAVVLSFCAWMWGSWVGYSTKPSRRWLTRIIAIAVAVSAGWAFLPAPAGELIDWRNYEPGLIKTAQAEGRPVLIKFTADWCWSCKVVDKIVYQRKDIAKLIEQKGTLAIKADTTEKDFPATLALKNIYNEPAVPVSMLFVPGSKEPVRWRGILFANDLKKSLDGLPNGKSNEKQIESQKNR